MSVVSVFEMIVKSIRELSVPGIGEKNIEAETSFREDLGVDSLNMLILLVKIQENIAFDLTSMKEGMGAIRQVKDLVGLLEKQEA